MAETLSRLPFSFTVDHVTGKVKVDTSINILRRRESIEYKAQTNLDSANLSLFGSEELNTRSTIAINDRSSSLVANRVDPDEPLVIAEGISSYILETDKFLVTDVFATDVGSVGQAPLFFYHTIDLEKVPRVSSTNLSMSAGVRLVSVEILDQNLEVLDIKDKFIDLDKGVIYNNLVSLFDSITDSFTAYYVRYTVKNGNSVLDFIDLLSNKNIFREATFDDYDSNMELINDGRKIYSIEEDGNEFTITLPVASTYAFRITADAKLKLLNDIRLGLDKPWRLYVSNTKFYTQFQNIFQRYLIGQFGSQSWNPEAPYKLSSEETALVLTKNLIKTNHSNIYQDTGFYVDIMINFASGEGIAAYTTNPSKSGILASNNTNYSKWNRVNRTGIKSIDAKGGFIEIEGVKLKSIYEIIVTYYYEEKNYEFNLIDLNPINNPDILTHKLVFFVIPDTFDQPLTKTLFYLKVDRAGKVVQSDWDNFSNVTQKTVVENKPLYYEAIPTWLDPAPNAEVFVPTYSTEGAGIYLILGDVYVAERSSPDIATNIDVREPGGGVIKEQIAEAKRDNVETNWFWDLGFWDGTAFPANASFYVEVPADIMEGTGGEFLSNEIKDIANRHVGFGIYPVVKTYGVDPIITEVIPTATTLAIKWRSHPGIKYRVYYSASSPTGPWTIHNDALINDNSSGNSYTITGLQEGVLYYVMVVGGKINQEGAWYPISGQSVGPEAEQAIGVTNPNLVTVSTFIQKITTENSLGISFTKV